MIKIIDTFAQINNLFEDGKFILDKWKTYMNSIYGNAANLVINDMKECFGSGDYVYEKDILPIITAVYKHADLEILHSSFCKVTEGLNKKVNDCFGNEVDIDIVLYVGLCNGAGCRDIYFSWRLCRRISISAENNGNYIFLNGKV